MLNFRLILFVLGVLLVILAAFMVIPAIIDLYGNNPDWKTFAVSSFLTVFIGGLLILMNRGKAEQLSIKGVFFLSTTSWLALVIFGALPFAFAQQNISIVDAFFESMSGITTTGATIITGLDTTPPGILLWRSILQWIGGIAMVVMAIMVLPMLKIGGMHLFRNESSESSEEALPRAKLFLGWIVTIYVIMTIVCSLLLWISGMTPFDAICHSMTTVSTGGFSTHDSSILYFNSELIENIMIIFMILSSLPFVIYVKMLHGNVLSLAQDTQIRAYFIILLLSLLIMIPWLYLQSNLPLDEVIRIAKFNLVSVLTTSGFITSDYSAWGSFALTFLFFLMVTGGCVGSTTGGIKIFRYQILLSMAKIQISRLVHPHGVFKSLFNKKIIPDPVTNSVMSFFVLYAFCFLTLVIALAITGLDFNASMSAAASSLANLGPGLSAVVGAHGNYAGLEDSTKMLLSFGMLLGRLELFTVLVLFSPYFWRT